ncbi:MAG: DUF5067 domain-containing protein [Eggerthellaceae bacterium]|jgi:ABC-type oligopeptide transport system substrate-binding subunit
MEQVRTDKRGLLAALIAVVALAACLALAGCGSDSESSSSSGDSASSAASVESSSTEDSPVTIKSCKSGRDYNGKKAAIIGIEWKNDTGEKAMFQTTYALTVYVDGEEVDRTFGNGDDWYDDQKKIADGKTQTFKAMYEWDGKSDIEVEVTDWAGGDQVIASKTFKK